MIFLLPIALIMVLKKIQLGVFVKLPLYIHYRSIVTPYSDFTFFYTSFHRHFFTHKKVHVRKSYKSFASWTILYAFPALDSLLSGAMLSFCCVIQCNISHLVCVCTCNFCNSLKKKKHSFARLGAHVNDLLKFYTSWLISWTFFFLPVE